MAILLEKHGFKIEDMVIESMDYAPLFLPDGARKAIDKVCDVIVACGMGDHLFVAARKTTEAA